ncbi:MAG: cytochrome d ubiquinol oxidase subunit II [Muribaculaceae bacterium]|nr:cytochrome d ubiquinol oxidase subunit II [Muribaculaceae bacterium]
METLQIYWWLVISLLGGILVFLLFVQGGQTMIWSERNPERKSLMVNALGRKWELTFTTLVVFGGAFFASFPLYYSTSFGGAYWLWMLILLSFILQAVSYEFRSKPGNVFGTMTYDWFLCINGCVGCILLGEAVAMQFFGADFTVTRGNILDASAPVISRWNSSHGFDVIFSLNNLLLGFAVYFLARTMGALFFIRYVNDIREADFLRRCRTRVLVNGTLFVALFLAFLFALFMSDGYGTDQNGMFIKIPYKYFFNFIDLWWVGASFLIGVLMVLYGVIRAAVDRKFTDGFWWAGAGVVIAVTCLFCVSGYNNTAYLPSPGDPQSSLTIYNSSSTEFTLKVMAWVTVLLPFVIAYIAYVWHKMTSPNISAKELDAEDHIY